MKRELAAIGIATTLISAPAAEVNPATQAPQNQKPDATLVVVGDIASCKVKDDDKLAKVVEKILTENKDAVLVTLGDNAYPKGRPEDFKNCYDPILGKFKKRTIPVIGNHEYEGSPTAYGYFNYFGEAAGENGKGYQAKNFGNWRTYMLNSEREFLGEAKWKKQVEWLQNDVKNHPSQFKISFEHHPYASSGYHGGDEDMKQFWDIFYHDRKTKLMMNGHDHHAEVFSPQTPDKERDYNSGIREVIIGTGGAYFYDVGKPVKNSVYQLEETPAVAKIDLYKNGSYKGEIVTLEKVVYTFSNTSK